jgi:hypothetical protein
MDNCPEEVDIFDSQTASILTVTGHACVPPDVART